MCLLSLEEDGGGGGDAGDAGCGSCGGGVCVYTP